MGLGDPAKNKLGGHIGGGSRVEPSLGSTVLKMVARIETGSNMVVNATLNPGGGNEPHG